MYRSVIEVDRPEPAFELAQLVLVPAASPPPIVPEWAQIAALYGVPTRRHARAVIWPGVASLPRRKPSATSTCRWWRCMHVL